MENKTVFVCVLANQFGEKVVKVVASERLAHLWSAQQEEVSSCLTLPDYYEFKVEGND